MLVREDVAVQTKAGLMCVAYGLCAGRVRQPARAHSSLELVESSARCSIQWLPRRLLQGIEPR